MKERIIYLLPIFLLFISPPANSQENINGIRVIASTPKELKEASGLAVTDDKGFWSHNDDTIPVLFKIDSSGNIVNSIRLNHKNKGWEDLAIDEEKNIYIGAFGNNFNNRQDLKIYKIPNPDSIDRILTNAEIIYFTYEDQTLFPPPKNQLHYDCDAMIFYQDSLYLFSKNRTEPFDGTVRIYAVPAVPGEHIARFIGSSYVCDGPMLECMITGADISPDGKTLALLTHDKVWLYKNFEGSNFFEGDKTEINLQHFSHKTGLVFKNENEVYIIEELEMGVLGGHLLEVNLSHWTD